MIATTAFNPQSTFEGLSVTRVTTEAAQRQLTGWTAGESHSELAVLIGVERRAAFYVWTIFTPVILIFLISCTVFIVPFQDFSSRIGIGLTALLACVATQFAMSFTLPQIAYLTVIDWVLLVAYACIALGVLVSTLQVTLLVQRPRLAGHVNRWAGFGLPVVFLVLIVLGVIW